MKFLSTTLLGMVLFGGTIIFLSSPAQEAPKLEDVYWGPGKPPKKLDTSIRPFKVVFSEEMIDDLKHRLNNTRKFQPSLENVGWTYGMTSEYTSKVVVNYWLNKYDFEEREEHLNRYPQFLTNIQGLDIHYIHVKPRLSRDHKVKVLPLYLQHGWPGSVVEFHKIIPMLTTRRPEYDFVFEVVVPSLPGFGYSSAAAKPGLGATEMAHLMKNLMLRLGFDKFYTQGGDWGGAVTANMASMYPQHVLGMHSNFCFIMRPWTMFKIAAYSWVPSMFPEFERQRMFPLKERYAYLIELTGYLHLQATKPDSLGMGMADSPAALAGYILEKFSEGTHPDNIYSDDGNLLKAFSMDELIDNLMYYWTPNKVTSSFRIYAESFNYKMFERNMDDVPVLPPSACAQFPHEIVFQSERFLRDRFVNLVHITQMPKGGHFAAMEEPQLLADDVFASVQAMIEFNGPEEESDRGKENRSRKFEEIDL